MKLLKSPPPLSYKPVQREPNPIINWLFKAFVMGAVLLIVWSISQVL